jgi:uncharacterized protein YqeY
LGQFKFTCFKPIPSLSSKHRLLKLTEKSDMPLMEQLQKDLKESMKARDSLRTSTLRTLLAALKNMSIALSGKLTDEACLKVLQKAARERKEAIEAYKKGGRNDRALGEREELKIIEKYLPQPLTEEQLTQLIQAAVKETKAQSLRDLGKVMKIIMPELRGRADGKSVQIKVQKILGG